MIRPAEDLHALQTFALVASLSAKNRVVQTLRRLRKPRYLISVAIGVAYFGWLLAGQARPELTPGGDGIPIQREGALIAGSILMLVLMLGAWALPKSDVGVEFTEAEIQMLFPAPLTRRQLLLYKIARSQPAVLFGAVVMRVFVFRDGNLLGVWLGLAMIDLYFLMVAFCRARLRQIGVGFVARVVGVVVLAGGVISFTASTIDIDFLGDLADAAKNASAPQSGEVLAVVGGLRRMFFSWPLGLVYGLPSVFIRPALAGSFATGMAWSPIVIVLGLASFALATRMDVAFEDASIEASRKKAEKMGIRREGAGRKVMFRHAPAMFRLAEAGPPETAIVWKNLIAAGRITLPIFGLILASLALVPMLASLKSGLEASLFLTGVVALGAAAGIAFIGPLAFRNDLRSEMRRMDMLKLLPVSGYRMIAAQIAAPALTILLLQIVLMLGGAAVLFPVVDRETWVALALWAPAAIVLAFPVSLIQLLFHNGIAILLPAWALDMSERRRGIEHTGKAILLMLAHLLFLAVGLLPAALVFVVVLWLASLAFDYGPAAGTIAVIPAAALILIEVHLLLLFLGGQFEEIDIANDLDLSPEG